MKHGNKNEFEKSEKKTTRECPFIFIDRVETNKEEKKLKKTICAH